MHITYISSYVPRKCGIATYTRDLAVEAQIQGNKVSLFALENPAILHSYTTPVESIISQQNKRDYIKAAKEINKSLTEIVHLQHEFGLFGGLDGEYIVTLAKLLTKPLIVTFHTVLLTPTQSQKKIIQELTRLSRRVIVMDKIAKDRLENVYGLNSKDITIIVHGAPSIEKASSVNAKKIIGYPEKFIMLANNLLSRNKGIEYGIDAVAQVVKSIPNILFLVVGETHPLVKSEEGESYRNELMSQVKRLGILSHVIFKNEYVSQEELKTLLSAADVYITPYLDPQQISSGTLSYAIGAGKACIATEYVYAKEMLAGNKGIIVPFQDSDSIAEALIDLFTYPERRLNFETKVRSIGKNMSWSKVFGKHFEVYNKIYFTEHNLAERISEFKNNPTNISYLVHLTNSTGIIQHANTIFPDLSFGYSTCDNARALIVASQMYKFHRSDEFLELIKIYSAFLDSAQVSDGKFHTFLNSEKNWSDNAGVTDGFGRALWGLGFNLYAVKNNQFKKPIQQLFEKSLIQLKNITDLRNVAYSILGLYYYILAFRDDAKITNPAIMYLKKLSDYIKTAYYKNSQKNWNWFEETITYDNFRLPQALFAVYLITREKAVKEIAQLSLKFITGCNFDKERGYYDFIGQDGWHSRKKIKSHYDQQPLEVAGAVDANLFAFQALEDQSYIKAGNLAFEWFFGNNRNHRSMYDIKSKGVSDGLTLRGINLNQGAESVICFLIASLSLKENTLVNTKLPKLPYHLTYPLNSKLNNSVLT